jgi:hypothetical protein
LLQFKRREKVLALFILIPISMKKFYLILLALSCASLVTGQPKKMLIPADRYAKPVPVITCDVPELPVLAGNASVNSKAMLEDIIGGSRYDLQTNYSIAPRLSLFPDGTLQAAWTMGFTEPGF